MAVTQKLNKAVSQESSGRRKKSRAAKDGAKDGANGVIAPHAVRGAKPEASSRPHPTATLDRVIHERTRLGMVSALAVNEVLTFNELKRILETSDGNLSVHARKLEEAGYVICGKGFAGRVPRTEYRLTALGRRTLEKYLNHMEALIEATRPK